MTLQIVPEDEKATRRGKWNWQSSKIDKDKDVVDKDRNAINKDTKLDKDEDDIDDIHFSKSFYDRLARVQKEMEDPEVRERYKRELDEKYGPKKKDPYLPVGDQVMQIVEGPDGLYTKVSRNMLRKVETFPNINVNRNFEIDKNVNQTIGNQFNSENVNKNIKIIDKDIEKDINKDIDVDAKDNDIDNREENFMADPDGYVPKIELLRRDMELGNKEIIKELGNLKEKEIQLEESVTGLDKKVCDGNDCHIDDQNRTNDIFRELRERIQFLERPRYVCPYCHTGILTQGESECNVCGGEVGKWKQKVEMVARG